MSPAPPRAPPSAAGRPLFRDVRLADEVRVIAEPRSLLPRSVQWTRSSELTGTDGNTMVQRDVKSWAYAWKATQK